MRKRSLLLLIFALICIGLFSACSDEEKPTTKTANFEVGSGETLRIVSGSENKELEFILEAFAKENNVRIEMDYLGSLEIMSMLGDENIDYDAVWPASSIWINMGDVNHKLKHQQTISNTPVVFGIRASKAKELGLDREDVGIADIAEKISAGQLSFAMTSATQSNSGASAYLAFLTALSGDGDVLQEESIHRPDLQEKIISLLSGVNRTSGSSNWLVDLFVTSDYDAMVNYEALIIAANRRLEEANKEPLTLVYPKDAISFANSPLAFVNEEDSKDKEELFLKLQEYLLSDDAQRQIVETGRRTAFNTIPKEQEEVFTRWGIQSTTVLSPIVFPKAEVIRQALDMYQTGFKKPAITVYCLDYSGSMRGEGSEQMLLGLEQLLVERYAKQNLLQGTAEDRSLFIPFDSDVRALYEAHGNGAELEKVYSLLKEERPDGGTAMYAAIFQGIKWLQSQDISKYSPAIVVLSDGVSKKDMSDETREAYEAWGADIPIFSILYGDADDDQLQELAEYSHARVFDGRKDLTSAFKSVKGYN